MRRRLSADDARAVQEYLTPKRPSKYRNVKTVVDGITFDSAKEARRYQELLLLKSSNVICNLRFQVDYKLMVGDVKIGIYRADFVFCDSETGDPVVEDVKGVKTPLYRWKKKHFEAQYGIRITET